MHVWSKAIHIIWKGEENQQIKGQEKYESQLCLITWETEHLKREAGVLRGKYSESVYLSSCPKNWEVDVKKMQQRQWKPNTLLPPEILGRIQQPMAPGSRAAQAHSSPAKHSDIEQCKGGSKNAIYSYLTNCSPNDIPLIQM